MRKNIAAGNWKMNKTYEEGIALAQAIVKDTPASDTVVIMCVPFPYIKAVADITKDAPNVFVGAQNCSTEPKGAFTGETSVAMLQSVGTDYVIIGHSERRQYFNESNEVLAKKVDAVLAGGLTPIFCCGEALDIREAGTHIEYVSKQIEEGLFHLSAEDFGKVVIAYEPIWAIGTGVTASPEQAQEMQKALRAVLAGKYGEDAANNTSILYGGSVKPHNAEVLFACPDVDGGLVGGASLKAELFIPIINAF